MLIPPILKVVLNSHLILYTGHRAPATFNLKMVNAIIPGGGVHLGILGGGVPPGSPNPDLISDRKLSFFTPVFRPGL